MRLILVGIVSIFLLSGCVSKKILVEEDLVYEQALKSSKSVQIKDGKKIQAYIVTTYINLIDSPYVPKNTNEKFLISIYTPQKTSLSSEIEFSINEDVNNTIVQTLSLKDDILKVLPTFSSWNRYYYVEIEAQENKTIKVEFATEAYGKTGIVFNKNYF
jgi:hypothetical protein